MDYFSIAGLQLEVSNQDNRPAIRSQVERTMRAFPWVEMIVIGELASRGSSIENAEQAGGETEQFYRGMALEHKVWLVPGSLYERCGDEVYNTTLAINPGGETVARYRKQFPFLPYEKGVTAGSDGVVFDVPGVGRFGLSICYDQWFPETTRNLVWMGAEIILCPTMTNTIDRELELCIARSNAIVNQCYFFNINVAGGLGNGRSVIVGPEGTVIHQAGANTEIIPVEVDLGLLRRVRERGVYGLGQVLKSFRDSEVAFPASALDQRRSAALDALGPLVLPEPPESRLE